MDTTPAVSDLMRPKVITWFRFYAGLLSILGAGFMAVGLFLFEPVSGKFPDLELDRIGLVLMGFALFGVHAVALLPVRRPWLWTYSLVVIALGVSSCFLPFCIPMLIFWVKRETKSYFNYVDKTPVA